MKNIVLVIVALVIVFTAAGIGYVVGLDEARKEMNDENFYEVGFYEGQNSIIDRLNDLGKSGNHINAKGSTAAAQLYYDDELRGRVVFIKNDGDKIKFGLAKDFDEVDSIQ